MTDPIIGGVGVGVTPDARDFWTRFREQTGGGAAEAGRRDGNDWQRGFNEGAGRPNIRPDVDTTRARAQLASLNRQIDQINRDTSRGGLLEYLAGIAPAVVPIAGAATAGGAALAVMGAQGLLAVKGISSAMADATNTGVQFGSGLSLLKGDLTQLQRTAAKGVLPGVDSAVTKLHASVPQLNIDLAQSTRVLGGIASSGASLATGLLNDLSPAVTTVEGDIAKLVRQGAAWANGPGGSAFGQALKTDFQQVEPVLLALLGDVGKLAAAANGPGLGIVSLFGDIATGLEHIPTPVLTALVTGLSAMKVAGVVSTLFGRLRLSVAGAAVAERDAAIAAQQAALAQGDLAAASRAAAAAQAASANVSRLRSFGGAAIGVLGRVAAGYLAIRIAADALSNATASLRTSTNGAQSFLGLLGQGFGDVADGRLTSLVSDIRQSQRTAAVTSAILTALNTQWTQYNHAQQIAVKGTTAVISGVGHLSKALQAQAQAGQGAQHSLTVGQQVQRSYDQSTRQVTASLRDQAAALHSQLTQVSAVSSLPGVFAQTAQSLQKQIDATQKFLSLGGQTVDTYKGVAIGANTYSAALARTNGDVPKATGLIHGMVDGLGRQKLALAAVQQQQERVNTFISDAVLHLTKQANAQKTSSSSSSGAAAQYQLTTQQVDLYSQALGINFDRLAHSTRYQQAANAELLKFAGALQNGDSALQGWVQAVATYNSSARTAADRGQLLAAALVSFNGDAIAYQSAINQTSVANQQLVKDLKSVHGGIVDVQHGTIDFHKAGAAPLLSDLAGIQSAAQNAAAAMYEHERQTKGATQASADAARLYRSQTYGVLVDEAKKLGLSAGAAHNLAKEYFGIPKDVVTQIKQLGGERTNTLLNAIGHQLSYLTGHRWTLNVDANTSAAQARLNALLNRIPSGTFTYNPVLDQRNHLHQATGSVDGPVRGSGTATSDSIPAWLSNGEFVVRASQTAKHLPLLEAINSGKNGFASGGLVALASHYRDWNPRLMAAIAMAESGGNAHAHNYNLGTGDDSYGLWQINMLGSMGPGRRAEFGIHSDSQLFSPSTNALAAHDIWRDQGYGAWSTYNNGAYLQFLGDGGTISNGGSGGTHLTPQQRQHRRHMNIHGQVQQAQAAFDSQNHPNQIIRQGNQFYVGGQSYDNRPAAREALAEQRFTNQQQRDQAIRQAVGQIPGSLTSFAHSLGSPSSERSAFNSLIGDVRDAGASDQFIARMRRESAAIRAAIRTRIADADTLQADHAKLVAVTQKFNQEVATVSSATRGAFDITSAGANANGVVSGGRINAQAKQQAVIVHRWGQGLRKLAGGPLGKSSAGNAMLRQLFENGPGDWPQVEALLRESGSELRGLIRSEQSIMDAGRAISHFEARRLYGPQIRQDRALVRQDRSTLAHDKALIDHMEAGMERAIVRVIKRLDVKIDPRGVARVVATGEKQLRQTGRRPKK